MSISNVLWQLNGKTCVKHTGPHLHTLLFFWLQNMLQFISSKHITFWPKRWWNWWCVADGQHMSLTCVCGGNNAKLIRLEINVLLRQGLGKGKFQWPTKLDSLIHLVLNRDCFCLFIAINKQLDFGLHVYHVCIKLIRFIRNNALGKWWCLQKNARTFYCLSSASLLAL